MRHGSFEVRQVVLHKAHGVQRAQLLSVLFTKERNASRLKRHQARIQEAAAADLPDPPPPACYSPPQVQLLAELLKVSSVPDDPSGTVVLHVPC